MKSLSKALLLVAVLGLAACNNPDRYGAAGAGGMGGAGAGGVGGAGGIESVFTVLALHHQKVPPTINLLNPDPECDLDYCANTARDMKIDVALKNNFGFGGTNGSLVFKRI